MQGTTKSLKKLFASTKLRTQSCCLSRNMHIYMYISEGPANINTCISSSFVVHDTIGALIFCLRLGHISTTKFTLANQLPQANERHWKIMKWQKAPKKTFRNMHIPPRDQLQYFALKIDFPRKFKPTMFIFFAHRREEILVEFGFKVLSTVLDMLKASSR